ncbi:SpvB/TcaC N-terminal domain-containing protein [Pseudomonas hamedanensis]|uniref:Toxin n=1 Tax=Pseudomonas hamedanensis TaxID=2745504 RepID=A0A9E6NZC1_9PSED|nr:SpvB/TcaC N-terminal domain-containing protein [Pseudomonas hamedanensis]QXI16735.1 toxin [Pseudomonas hamedanensis]
MAEPELSIVTPSIAKSSSITTVGRSWGAVGPTGAAAFELPIPLTSGWGLAPTLSLSYSSQTGNGPFGVGWGLGLSQISRRTNKGVPRYTEHDEIIGHDGEVWMPELEADGSLKWRVESTYNGEYIGLHRVVRYWPRVESDFALREFWQRQSREAAPPTFWLIHGADGSLHVYGKTAASRREDPDDPQRIASWLLCESMNAHGQHICFLYKADEEEPDPIHDYRAQRYLERVCYGNFTASAQLFAWTVATPGDLAWQFQLVFDYGERTTSLTETPPFDADISGSWSLRPDPFSTYGQGFEIGTRRLCRQVLMFHQNPANLGAKPLLARRLLLEYHTPQNVTQWAYSQIGAAHYQAFDANGKVEHTPPVEFDYSTFEINKTPQRLLDADHQPGVEDGGFYQCVDLYGEGIPGFLCRYDQAWYYREPMRSEPDTDQISYGPWALLDKIPVADRGRASAQLIDMTGSGRLDLLISQPGSSGFHALTPEREFERFVLFNKFPLEYSHALLTQGDFGGDGLISLALIGTHAVRLYRNEREQGFAAAQEVFHQHDRLPLLSNSRTELVVLGNLLGSDMPELCRIRHDEIRCWPNLGHGRFGEGQTISALPFAYEQFDSSRVRLADLDGSGAPALIYLKSDVFEIYLNRGGNGLEQIPVSVPWPEGVRYDSLCQVSFADLQGLGCASLILTVTHVHPQHWRYDFVAAKPYLLTASNNNMGCSASVVYRSSAQEWLDEKYDLLKLGRAPASYLPFPVALVKKQQQLDEITGNCLTQLFTWREGVYDSREREFRGFGQLQQVDSESATGDDDIGFSQPARVCTWFHTGQAMDRPRDDYFNDDKDAIALGPTLFSLTPPHENDFDDPLPPHDGDTQYQIARALVGSVTRIETYADNDVAEPGVATLFSVEERRYLVREVRPQGQYAAAVLLPLLVESINYQYDRVIDDPLCRHETNMRWNAFGSLIHALTVSYARRLTKDRPPPFTDPDEQQWWRDAHDPAQQSFYLSEMLAQFIDLIDPQQWRLGLPYLQRGNALVLPKGTLPIGLSAGQVSYEQLKLHQDSPHWRTERVLTTQSVQRYVKKDGTPLDDGVAEFEALRGRLELAQLDNVALAAYGDLPEPFNIHTELIKIGYTPMAFLFEPTAPPGADPALYSAHFGFAEYAGLDGFYKVLRYRETLSHGFTCATYDAHGLAIVRVELPDGCTTHIAYDYHALQPSRITDPNDNIEEALYAPSGQPLATSFHGTENTIAAGFKPLDEYVPPQDHRPDPAIADPVAAVQYAASALRRDLFSWMGQIAAPADTLAQWAVDGYLLPSGHIRASARQRLTRRATLAPAEQQLLAAIEAAHREPVHSVVLSADRDYYDETPAQFQIIKACVDGFGRALQTQQRVDPGMAYKVVEGSLVIEDGKYVEVYADPRWRISAWVEYNNKALPIRQYRAFHANAHGYINDHSMRELGYFDQLFYDALGRLIKVINAKGDYALDHHHPWYKTHLDFNDTASPPDRAKAQAS